MSETVILWLFGTLITLQTLAIGGLVTVFWSHISQCKETAATTARIDTNLARVMTDIGDHSSGLRGQVHELAGFVNELEKRLYSIEQQRGGDR